MTDETLQALLRYWQGRLRLRDWEITAAFVRHTDLGPDVDAECRQVLSKKWARIVLLDPIDRQTRGDYRDAHDDIERDLVHELLHCYPAFDTDRIQKPKHERRVELTIHPLSTALIEEHRMGND